MTREGLKMGEIWAQQSPLNPTLFFQESSTGKPVPAEVGIFDRLKDRGDSLIAAHLFTLAARHPAKRGTVEAPPEADRLRT